MGLEPTVSRATIWRVNQLRYTHHMARLEGFEPPAHGLEGRCSIRLSYRRKPMDRPPISAAHSGQTVLSADSNRLYH